jgi:hypothetical protein
MRTCTVGGCTGKYLAKGMCATHYHREWNRAHRRTSRRAVRHYHYAAAAVLSDRDRTDCWVDGPFFKRPDGYLAVKVKGRGTTVPRYVLWLVNGRWPDTACHKCDNPTCWNPDHLYDGTTVLNTDDRDRRERIARAPQGFFVGRS